jgi:hypothetical protein
VRLHLGNEQYFYFSTFADYTLNEGQFSLNGFFAMKINVQKDRFVSFYQQKIRFNYIFLV